MRELTLMTAAALAYVAGGVCMKWSAGLTRPGPSALLFTLFGAGAALQALAMRNAQMGSTYVLVLGMEAVFAFLAGHWVFSEPVTVPRALAVALIAAGIVLLKR